MAKLKLSSVVLSLIGALFAILIVGMVASSLRRPELETFVPTAPQPADVGEAMLGPRDYTVDARAHDAWVYFDFSRGSTVEVESRQSLDWDLAFQRHRIISNGGATNLRGQAGVRDLGAVEITARLQLPDTGYVVDQRRGDTPRNRLLEDWYDYSWTSHILRPADRTYAVRTADGKYAVLRFLGYYCPGGRPGCVAFRYRYLGDGGRELAGLEAARPPGI